MYLFYSLKWLECQVDCLHLILAAPPPLCRVLLERESFCFAVQRSKMLVFSLEKTRKAKCTQRVCQKKLGRMVLFFV